MSELDKSVSLTLYDAIQAVPVIPVIVLQRVSDAIPVAEALIEGGISIFEITMRTEAALPAIEEIAAQFPDALTGVGTVLNKQQAQQAADSGAQFIVSPGFDTATVEFAQAAGIPIVPGVSTASEVQLARNLGLRILKFFPAGAAGGIAMLKAFSSVFADVQFVPTGGVTASNLADYLAVPNVVACGGSWLAPVKLVADGQFNEISRLTAAAIEIARETES
jgi:2-dehydro-3-deoxyphosphogluconate aldolase/(4S)-4-hydroxy-2-oxoglutarate aldolase